MGRAVEVAAERDAVLVDDPQVAERHDLEAARVGEDRPIPVHEPVQAAEPLDALRAGPQVQVVGVGEDDRRAGLGDLGRGERLDRGVRADRHELRRLDDAVGQRQLPEPCPRRAIRGRRDQDLEAGRLAVVRGGHASTVGATSRAGRPRGSASRPRRGAAAGSRSRARRGGRGPGPSRSGPAASGR